ncbi:hypothetical protein EV648_12341 [Kribbella sp. VKM Ac-2568]|nr:hypothetical protein EV648_12341 [Kribbella sp. VKM Ac-2568]
MANLPRRWRRPTHRGAFDLGNEVEPPVLPGDDVRGPPTATGISTVEHNDVGAGQGNGRTDCGDHGRLPSFVPTDTLGEQKMCCEVGENGRGESEQPRGDGDHLALVVAARARVVPPNLHALVTLASSEMAGWLDMLAGRESALVCPRQQHPIAPVLLAHVKADIVEPTVRAVVTRVGRLHDARHNGAIVRQQFDREHLAVTLRMRGTGRNEFRAFEDLPFAPRYAKAGARSGLRDSRSPLVSALEMVQVFQLLEVAPGLRPSLTVGIPRHPRVTGMTRSPRPVTRV